jgi:hypothetical protein
MRWTRLCSVLGPRKMVRPASNLRTNVQLTWRWVGSTLGASGALVGYARGAARMACAKPLRSSGVSRGSHEHARENTAGSPAAFVAWVLLFAPSVYAQPVYESLGEVLLGRAAFGDWRTDAPWFGAKSPSCHHRTPPDQRQTSPRVIAKPISAPPRV